MKKVLKIEAHQTRTLKWWNSRRESIDFEPPYQRKGRLWSDKDKSFLIDSILNGFDIPKLYLADFQYGHSELNVNKLPYAIIDGKQRLEAVFDFFDNELVLDKSFVWREDSSLKLGGLSLRDLQRNHSHVAEEFENASFSMMSVFTNDETLINDLFVRLNRSKALTGAEVRNAISGPVTELIRELTKHLLFSETIRFSTKRAGDQNAAGKVLLFEYEGELVSTKKRDLDDFASNGKIEKEKLELSARRVLDIFDEMAEIFIPSDVLLSSSGQFPVYYWFVRMVDSVFHDHVRAFLLDFEDRRKQNRDFQRGDGTESNLEGVLARYDTLNRSTNDGGSHMGRFTILIDEFSNYLDVSQDDLLR